jgi:archaellum component FlaC
MQTAELGKAGDRMDEQSGSIERLDEKVDGLGKRVGRLEHSVDELTREMHAEFRSARAEIKSMQMLMIGGFLTMFATMIGGFVTLLAQI